MYLKDQLLHALSGHCAWAIGEHGAGPTEHDAAMEIWEAFRKAHVPGLKFCDRPRHILIPRDMLYEWEGNERHSTTLMQVSTQDFELDETRWDEIAELIHSLPSQGEKDLVPKRWKYRNILPIGIAFSTHDELNPRLYGMDGYMIRQRLTGNVGGFAKSLCDTFEARLCDLFNTTPRNERRDMVEARLFHHLKHGGNPKAFREYVEDLLVRWKAEMPSIVTGRVGLQPINVMHLPNAIHLVGYIREWLDNARKVPTSAKATTLAKSKRSDLKLVALVHALRWLAAKDREADISKDNAQALAEAAGSKGKQAGKDLFDRYTLYTLKANSKAERMQDGQPHTVKKRYLVAITMLEDHPKAKDMAERELEELHAEKVDAGK